MVYKIYTVNDCTRYFDGMIIGKKIPESGRIYLVNTPGYPLAGLSRLHISSRFLSDTIPNNFTH
jgi:hypothetical protein